jgi:hypothetical protein
VQGKPPGGLRQRVLRFGQLPAYLGQKLPVDPVDQPDKDIIEQGNLVGGQAVNVA